MRNDTKKNIKMNLTLNANFYKTLQDLAERDHLEHLFITQEFKKAKHYIWSIFQKDNKTDDAKKAMKYYHPDNTIKSPTATAGREKTKTGTGLNIRLVPSATRILNYSGL